MNCGYEFVEAVYHPLAGDALCCPRCGAAGVVPDEAKTESEVQPMSDAFEACKNPYAYWWWNGWLLGVACGLGLAVVSYHLVWWIGQVWELGL